MPSLQRHLPNYVHSARQTDRLMAEELTCCICGDPVTAPYHIVGGRVYCDRHYAIVNKPHRGFWRAGIAQIVGVGSSVRWSRPWPVSWAHLAALH